MSDDKKALSDPFVRQHVFPDASEVFAFAPVALSEVVGEAVVVVDTNALLVPYNTGAASIAQIRLTYERLAADDRLRVPGQVAREFAVHRAEKIKTLFQQISRRRNLPVARSEYPLLEGLPTYTEVQRLEAELSKQISEYRKALAALLDTVGAWNWDDPVSSLYREVFRGGVIVDPPLDQAEVIKDLKYRHEHLIPPGYKDAGNQFSGVGDLIIWQTILNIGRSTQKHLVFVSGDEKTDWRYQSENQTLYVRYELLDEYRRASEGKSLHIISFAELLKEFGAPAAVVAEVRQEETTASLVGGDSAAGLPDVASSRTQRLLRARTGERAVYQWLRGEHPRASVIIDQDGFPDLTVAGPEHVVGYEVKTIYRAVDALHRAMHLRRQITTVADDRIRSFALVLIADNDDVLAGAIRAIERFPLPSRVQLVSVGILADDDRYEERFRAVRGQNAARRRPE